MKITKQPRDWWSRSIALIGLALSVCSLQWQWTIWQQNIEERILARISAEIVRLPGEHQSLDPTGKVGVEVVNIGMHPIYIKSVTAETGLGNLRFYQHDPLNSNEPLHRLEPGEPVNYVANVVFVDHPIFGNPGVDVRIRVETTKKAFNQMTRFNGLSVYQSLPSASH